MKNNQITDFISEMRDKTEEVIATFDLIRKQVRILLNTKTN